MGDLWCDVGDKCLICANAMLGGETAPTAATVEAVKALVEAAISIELLRLRGQGQIRSCVAGRLGSASGLQAEES